MIHFELERDKLEEESSSTASTVKECFWSRHFITTLAAVNECTELSTREFQLNLSSTVITDLITMTTSTT